MSRCTITFEDSLEVDIKRYMQKKNIKLRKTWCFLQLIIYETNVIKV